MYILNTDFNSHLHAGGDHLPPEKSRELRNFNSHLHAGGDELKEFDPAHPDISTHTSTREVTIYSEPMAI